MLPYKNKALPLDERVRDLISRLTLEEKISLLPTKQAAIPRLNINEYSVGGEGAHGVVDREGGCTTVFPQPIALSSTWNTELMEQIGSAIGDEARVLHQRSGRKGWLTLWFPTIDLERDPRWGRTEEAYGEDPYLAGKLSAALIRGAQGNDEFYVKIAAAPKHFYANNTENERATASSVIDKRNKHEYYLKVFSYAFKEGKALSLMTAYNEINGRPCILNGEVQKIVKDEWGCDGFIVCDGNDFEQTVTLHKYYETHAQTVAGALKAGVDCFTDAKELVVSAAKEAVSIGLITEEDIDRALYNIFKVRIRLGEFDSDNPYYNILEERLCSKENASLSLKAAREAVTLLKNDSFLPLNKDKLKKVLVVGDIAEKLYPGWYEGTPENKSTILNAVRKELEGKEVIYEPLRDTVSFYDEASGGYIKVDDEGNISNTADYGGRSVFIEADWGFGSFSYLETRLNKYLTADGEETDPKTGGSKTKGCLRVTAESVYGWFTKELFICNENDGYFTHEGSGARWKKHYKSDGITPAVNAAKDACAVIIVMGNHPLINGRECVDRTDIAFPKRWTDIIEKISGVNKNCVLAVTAGYPYAIEKEAGMVRAVLYTGQGSQSLGRAVSDCVFGNYSPAGRLSMTWYLSASDLPDINDYNIIGKRTYQYFDKRVLYPFGYGLSYSSFEYSNLQLSKQRLIQGEDCSVKVSFTVKNTGNFEADEVPQLYFKADNPFVKRPLKQLAGFTRIGLKPGEAKTIEFDLLLSELEYFDIYSNRPIIESGGYAVFIGASSSDIRLTCSFFVEADTVCVRDMGFVCAENYDYIKNITILEDKHAHTCIGAVGDGEAVYLNCGFTGLETKLNIRFGEGSQGKIKIFAGGELIAEAEAKDAEAGSACLTVSIKEKTREIKILLLENCMLRDFSFE